MSNFNWPGMAPGVGSIVQANFKALFLSHTEQFLAQGRYIAGDASRDPTNTTDVTVLQPGTVMGKIGSVVNSLGTVGFYAPSILGLTSIAITNATTSLTLPAAVATEIKRRCGVTGTVNITGAPVASGVVRTLTATYSAVGATSITIASMAKNEVQQINFNIASTGGNVQLLVPHPSGDMISTTVAAWSATDATYLANIQTVLDVATGVVNGIVVSAIPSVDPDLGFILTYSGTGYANLPQPMASVYGTLPTSSTTWNAIRNVAGVDGRFVTGSIVAPTDGSQTPLSIIDDWTPGISCLDNTGTGTSLVQVDFGRFPIAGVLDTGSIVNFPADPSARVWLEQQLSTASGGKFIFSGSAGPY